MPKIEYGEDIKYLGRYLFYKRAKGTILTINMKQDMEVYANTYCSGNYDIQDTQSRKTVRSRYGYIVIYKGCPVSWKSQLQTEICLSSIESEYTGLSHGLREVITLIHLL